jgi:hypothetical protein
MIGSGSGASTRPTPADRRLRRSTASTANGTTTSRRKSRTWPGRREPCDASAQGRATSADGRFSSGPSGGAGSTGADSRWGAVAAAGCPRPRSDRRGPDPRASRPIAWPATRWVKLVAIASGWGARIVTQLTGSVTKGVTLNTWDAGSASSTSAWAVAGSGSTAAVGATSAGVSTGADALGSAAGAGAPESCVAPGVAAGSSSAGSSAVGSSSYDGRDAGEPTGGVAGALAGGD